MSKVSYIDTPTDRFDEYEGIERRYLHDYHSVMGDRVDESVIKEYDDDEPNNRVKYDVIPQDLSYSSRIRTIAKEVYHG